MPTSGRDSRTTAVAWAASLTVHALLTTGLVWGVRNGTRSGGESADREIGVVLRETARPPSPFESDSPFDSDAVDPVESQPVEPTEAEVTLPPSPFSALLEEFVAERPEGAGPPSSDGGSAAPPPPTGGGRTRLPIDQTRVSFLGVEGVGSRFVYVLDRSTSMQGGPLRAVKTHLIQSLDAIEEQHQFHILFFNTRVATIDLTGGRRRIAYGTDANKRRAATLVRSVTADGGTRRFDALLAALAFRPDALFFLTDDDSPMTAAELAEVLDEAAGAVTIHAIEFGKGPDPGRRNFLVELAEQTGGQRSYIDTSRLPR